MRKTCFLSLLAVAVLLVSASATFAIPICGNGICERNATPAENIYNCPQDCCGGFTLPSPEEDGLSFLENKSPLMTPVPVEEPAAEGLEFEPAA